MALSLYQTKYKGRPHCQVVPKMWALTNCSNINNYQYNLLSPKFVDENLEEYKTLFHIKMQQETNQIMS